MTLHSLYLALTLVLSQSRSVMKADTKVLPGWQWLCLFKKHLTYTFLLLSSLCPSDIKFAFNFCHCFQVVFHLPMTQHFSNLSFHFFSGVIILVCYSPMDDDQFLFIFTLLLTMNTYIWNLKRDMLLQRNPWISNFNCRMWLFYSLTEFSSIIAVILWIYSE